MAWFESMEQPLAVSVQNAVQILHTPPGLVTLFIKILNHAAEDLFVP
jgi:hypothetical protein